MHRRSVTTRELAQELSAELVGDASREVTHLAPIGTADAQAVAFLAHPKYRQQAEGSAAGCLILPVALADLARDWPTGLPSGIIHADYFPDNVLFMHDQVGGVIDFAWRRTGFTGSLRSPRRRACASGRRRSR